MGGDRERRRDARDGRGGNSRDEKKSRKEDRRRDRDADRRHGDYSRDHERRGHFFGGGHPPQHSWAQTSSTSFPSDTGHHAAREHQQQQTPQDQISDELDIDISKHVNAPNVNVKKARTNMLREHLEYTNASNPFGDSMLTEKFVWNKKNELDDAKAGGERAKSTKQEQIRENAKKIEEIQRIRKRREEREAEKVELDAQREQLERERLYEENANWFAEEDEFQYKQTLERAQMRIAQRRENLLDLLTCALLLVDSCASSESEKLAMATAGENYSNPDRSSAPSSVPLKKAFPDGLICLPDEDPVSKVEKLPSPAHVDALLKEARGVDDHRHKAYWEALVVLLEEEAEKRRNGLGPGTGSGTAAGAKAKNKNDSSEQRIEQDLKEMLDGQSLEELEQTEADLKQEIEDNSEFADLDFYAKVLEKLPLYKARALLKWTHTEAVRLAKLQIDNQAADSVLPENQAAGGNNKQPVYRLFLKQGIVDLTGGSAQAATADPASFASIKAASNNGPQSYGGDNIWGARKNIIAESMNDVKDLDVKVQGESLKADQAAIRLSIKVAAGRYAAGDDLGVEVLDGGNKQNNRHGFIGYAEDGEVMQGEEELITPGSPSDDDTPKNEKGKGKGAAAGPSKPQQLKLSNVAPVDEEALEEHDLSPKLLPFKFFAHKTVFDERNGIQKTAPLKEGIDYMFVTQEDDVHQRRKNYQNLVLRYGGVIDEEGDRWVEQMRRKGLKNGEMEFNAKMNTAPVFMNKADAALAKVKTYESDDSDEEVDEDGNPIGDSLENKGDQGEVELARIHYDWEKKYRPRKPRFFNRVKTGFWWNKYNSTHYDMEVPPPKVVQGYRFNLFYPDLIDKRSTPKYFIEKAQGSATSTLGNYQETVQIRFSAGPPYEDIAFKIVNKEWNLNVRRGFRCVFDRGVLQLYFNFKGFNYRR
eukprot:CAMPEP_0178993564 /NCGR_PEP_ID=MMETSP0795-20121207/6774_1 /TAXON_ID=88552 /ORGANISM="Amoebophrya sp., Strain Ameob2" /LENGTH=929 /DNA_ID=CAMNT_0020685639 /DNA_START=178 /DNA_END=2967 /DNA_ORIENTATION=-